MNNFREWRTAGGAAHKIKDKPELVLPFKDVGASEPGLDICAGIMEADDSINNLLLGEATEEITYIDPESVENDGPTTIYVGDIIENTSVEDRFRDFYDKTSELSDGNIPQEYKIEFIDSNLSSPNKSVLDSTEQYGDKVFGAVHQAPVTEDDKWSRELTEYLELELPEDAVPLDLEIVEGEDPFWLNRIDVKTNIETSETEVYRAGKLLYEGSFSDALNYVDQEVDDWGYNTENLDENQKNPYTNPFNVKSTAVVKGMDTEIHQNIQQYLH